MLLLNLVLCCCVLSYVAAAAQVGKHNSRRESYGHAMIIDPWVCEIPFDSQTHRITNKNEKKKPTTILSFLSLSLSFEGRSGCKLWRQRVEHCCC